MLRTCFLKLPFRGFISLCILCINFFFNCVGLVLSNGTLLSVGGEGPIVLTIAWLIWGFPWYHFGQQLNWINPFSYWKYGLMTRDGQLDISIPHYLKSSFNCPHIF